MSRLLFGLVTLLLFPFVDPLFPLGDLVVGVVWIVGEGGGESYADVVMGLGGGEEYICVVGMSISSAPSDGTLKNLSISCAAFSADRTPIYWSYLCCQT